MLWIYENGGVHVIPLWKAALSRARTVFSGSLGINFSVCFAIASNEIYPLEPTTLHIEKLPLSSMKKKILKKSYGIPISDYFNSGFEVKTFNRSTTPASFWSFLTVIKSGF